MEPSFYFTIFRETFKFSESETRNSKPGTYSPVKRLSNSENIIAVAPQRTCPSTI